MIFRVPFYYNTFKCIADKCSDNCCIGWEIEIDSDTAEYYKSVGGAFGKRLSENISEENSFILKGERCPFLNEKNLCDIIINCGEEHLCQICRDHPRYFEWYGNIKEGGIGLSCEEGARLILTDNRTEIAESVVDEAEEPVDEELFSVLLKAREEVFAILDGDGGAYERLAGLLDYGERLQFMLDNAETGAEYLPCTEASHCDFGEAVKLLDDFESIGADWDKALGDALSSEVMLTPTPQEEKYMLNLCRYFIWRYFLKGVFDGEILSKVKLAVVSVLYIKHMTKGDSSLANWIEKSKLYSKQMEYSDENRELFYDYTYEKDCLSTNEIKGIIRQG